jgi:rod shape-determining protein MreD
MTRAVLSTFFWLVIAGALQQAVAHRIAIGWGVPDFLLVFAIVLSMQRSSDAAAVTGFAAGVFSGALLNEAIAAFSISRMVACVVASRIATSLLDRSPLNVTIVASVCTVVAAATYLFVFPFVVGPPNIGAHLADTIGAAIYNGVIAIPIHLLVQRVAGTAARG